MNQSANTYILQSTPRDNKIEYLQLQMSVLSSSPECSHWLKLVIMFPAPNKEWSRLQSSASYSVNLYM